MKRTLYLAFSVVMYDVFFSLPSTRVGLTQFIVEYQGTQNIIPSN